MTSYFKTTLVGQSQACKEHELLHNVNDDRGDGLADPGEDDELLDAADVGLRASSRCQ